MKSTTSDTNNDLSQENLRAAINMAQALRMQARDSARRGRLMTAMTAATLIAFVLGIGVLSENVITKMAFARIRVTEVPPLAGWASGQVQNPPSNDPRDVFLRVQMEKQNLQDQLVDRTWVWTEVARITGIISVAALAIFAVRLFVMFGKYHYRVADNVSFMATVAEGYALHSELCVKLLDHCPGERTSFGRDPDVPIEKIATAFAQKDIRA